MSGSARRMGRKGKVRAFGLVRGPAPFGQQIAAADIHADPVGGRFPAHSCRSSLTEQKAGSI